MRFRIVDSRFLTASIGNVGSICNTQPPADDQLQVSANDGFLAVEFRDMTKTSMVNHRRKFG
jgi:hypothetical protein